MAAMVLIGLFAAASFFFAVAETALFSLGKWQARRLADQGGAAGRLVARLLAEPQDLLATIVLGNTVANAGIVAMGFWLGTHAHWPPLLTLAGSLALILIGCEVIPKTMAVRGPDRWSLRIARPMQWLHRSSRPLQRLAQALNRILVTISVPKTVRPQTELSDEEYQELLELAYQQGTLARSEKEIILQIISLDRHTAKDVMRPRSQMACISDDLTVEEMIAEARRLQHRRLPVYDEATDTIIGVLNTRALLLNPQIDLTEAIDFPSFVPDSMNLLQLLKSLQRQQRGLAIVLDEFGGTAGLVTVEDILEMVVGEIRRESEDAGFVMEKLGEGRWRVSGTMRIEDFRREYPAIPSTPEVETMGGLMVVQMEVVPAKGQSLVLHGVKLTALVTDERRVREVLVETVKKRGGP